LAGEERATCPRCGSDEPRPGLLAIIRTVKGSGLRCQVCGSLSPLWLAALPPFLVIVFSLLAQRWPPGPGLLTASFYAAVLALVSALDLRGRLVYPLLTYPATILAALLTPLAFGQGMSSGLAGALAGAAVFFLFYLLGAVLYRGRGALGLGDVMIAGLIGAMVGLPTVATTLSLATVFGGLAGLAVMVAQRSRRAYFAYGPALCLAALLTLLSGAPT
jgi:leader peptidase (prepilin peptidase)/N-methyltransferase